MKPAAASGVTRQPAAVSSESFYAQDSDDPTKEEPSAHPKSALPVHHCKVRWTSAGNIRANIVACKCNQLDDPLGRNHKLTLIVEYTLKKYQARWRQ
jgi:hypothetical protein